MRRNNRARKRIIERIHTQIELVNELSRHALDTETQHPAQPETTSVTALLRSALTAALLLERQRLSVACKAKLTAKKAAPERRGAPPALKPKSSLPKNTFEIIDLKSLEDALRARERSWSD